MMGVFGESERATVWVSNIHQTVIAKDLLDFFESQLSCDSIFALEIHTNRNNWKSRGIGRVQLASLEHKSKALDRSLNKRLSFKSRNLWICRNTSTQPNPEPPSPFVKSQFQSINGSDSISVSSLSELFIQSFLLLDSFTYGSTHLTRFCFLKCNGLFPVLGWRDEDLDCVFDWWWVGLISSVGGESVGLVWC